MQFNIINDTTETAFFQLGLGTFEVTQDGTAFAVGDHVTIAAHTTQSVDITEAINAKLLLSLGSILVSDAPSPSNSGLTDYNTMWDKVELNLFLPTDTIDQSAINLSSTDFYGLDLQIQTFTTAEPTTPAQTLGWTQDTVEMLGSLAALTNYNTAAVMIGTGGIPIDAKSGTIDVLRVIAPSTIGGTPSSNPYPSFQAYIDNVETIGVATTIEGTYSRAGTTTATMTQGYSFVATVPHTGVYKGDLVMTGGGFVIPAGTTSVGGGHTIIVLGTDLANGIYTANPPFTVDGVSDTIAANDVYAAALRDMLGGFDLGFVGSDTEDAVTGVAFKDESSNNWYAQNNGTAVNGALAFGNAQPTHATFYDQYAGIVAKYSNSYGAPFSDLLPGPQANLAPTTIDHVNITIEAGSVPGPIPCFATGTPIMTETGEIAIERLTVGTRLPTQLRQRLAEVIWIGHRTVDCRRHPHPSDVQPVRVLCNAIGPGIPHCDVLLSPDHALLLNEVLIPVRYLVNGITIRQEQVDTITYWHVELDNHDVILAAGLPAETFLDTGNRTAFLNTGHVIIAHPDFGRWTWDGAGCAPLVIAGAKLEQAREQHRQTAATLTTSRAIASAIRATVPGSTAWGQRSCGK